MNKFLILSIVLACCSNLHGKAELNDTLIIESNRIEQYENHIQLNATLSNSTITSGDVQVDVDYHNRDCFGGTGLCNTTGDISIDLNGNTSVSKVTAHSITFTVAKSNFTVSEQTELIGKTFSLISTDEIFDYYQNNTITLDATIISNLGIESSFSKIRDGYYLLEFDGDDMIITFTLNTN